MKNKVRYSFAALLSAYKVEIPVIQRDFAQGRENIPKIEQIRKDFLGALIRALNDNKPLHLDFIYGKARRNTHRELLAQNRASIENLLQAVQVYSNSLDVQISYELPPEEHRESFADYFIPLDGQQRLTTLYLLHWYLAYRTGEEPKLLDRFTYKTRTSSMEFCKALVEHIRDLNRNDGSIRQLLEDQHFVFGEWLLDPTVSGMLVMLEEMHILLKRTSGEELMTYYRRLYDQEAPIISFDFLDLDRIGAEDELYVKMNSRGKQLTDFENFKSWLIGYTTDRGIIPMPDWDRKMDMGWMDILWKHRETVTDVDFAYLGLFKKFGQYCYITARQKDGRADLSMETRSIVEKLDDSEQYLPFSFYEENAIFNQRSLFFLFQFLSLLEGEGSNALDRLVARDVGEAFFNYSFTKALFTTTLRLNLFHKTFLYAVIRFVLALNKPVGEFDEGDEQLFFEWMRVSRNLIYNSRIDNSSEYVSAITSLYSLADHCLDITTYLAGEPNILYFPVRQREEEVRKALLIGIDRGWIEDLSHCEKQPYFYGQIGFLLDLATTDGRISDRAVFRDYGDKAGHLFTSENLDGPKFRLQRALLCKGDYLVDKGSFRKSFCMSNMSDARDRDENWRAVFNDKGAGGGRSILKSLMDSPDSLDEIIEQGDRQINDWRKYFIQYPQLIAVCGQRMIRIAEEEKGRSSVMLLGQSRISHYHRELYTSLLHLWLDPEQNKEDYIYKPWKGTDELPWLEITVEKGLIQLSYDAREGLYKIWLNGDNQTLKQRLLDSGYTERKDCLVKAADENIIFNDIKSIVRR